MIIMENKIIKSINQVKNMSKLRCVKSVRIRGYSGLHFHFPAFGLNTEIYSVYLRIQSECGKMGARITPNADTFYAVLKGTRQRIYQLIKEKSIER